MTHIVCGWLLTSGLAPAGALASTNLATALHTLRAVGPEGQGNTEASRAWKVVAASAPSALPEVLSGFAGANELTANWLRAAVASIAERASPERLPLAGLGRFLLDASHDPRARRLAFELIARADPATADRLLPGMLADPSSELRRDAVQKVIAQATATLDGGNRPAATLLFQQALSFARDVDQIDLVSKKLRALGQSIELPRLFGFVTNWMVIGPFDSTGGKGFDAVFPPEREIDLSAGYDGKSGQVRWQAYATTNEYGAADLNQPLGKLKGVAGYAFAEFTSDSAQAVELRLGSENAWKVWLNGALLFGREEYHRNREIDQYRMPAQLKPGRNTILVKVCQNEQTEDWAGDWLFQLRVCDALGTPVRSAGESASGGAR